MKNDFLISIRDFMYAIEMQPSKNMEFFQRQHPVFRISIIKIIFNAICLVLYEIHTYYILSIAKILAKCKTKREYNALRLREQNSRVNTEINNIG